MIPKYTTNLFTDIWDEAADFKADYVASPLVGAIHYGETVGQVTYPDNVTTLYYLLYARYGNNPIANYDEEQFKYKVFTIMWQYGPAWQKRLDIQEKLRNLSEEDILKGARAIHNHAYNPNQAPSTASLEEVEYINEQSSSNYKKSKMEAYAQLWDLISTDVTQEFLNKFQKCFKQFVAPERMLLYVTETEDEGNE